MKTVSRAIEQSQKSSIRKLFELVLTAKDAISFGIGQPNFSIPDHVGDAIIGAVQDKKTQYAPTLGLPELRKQVAEKFQRDNNLSWVSSKNVMVVNGGSHGLQLSYAALTNPGDEIIVNSPNFLSYYYLSSFYQLKCVEIPRNRDFSVDLDAIEKAITEKTKFIIINTPNNPTGYVYTKEEMDKLVEIVIEHDLYLISDEVYEYFIYDGAAQISPASYEGMKDRTVTLNAMSKTFGAPGLRVGFIAASEKIIELMEKYAQYSAAGVNHPTQYGAISAMKNGNEELPKILESYDKKRKFCAKRLRELKFEVNEPKGAFYIMPSIKNFTSFKDSDDFAQQLMKEVEVAVVPGSAFGAFSNDHIRISYATDDDKLEEGFNRIELFLKKKGEI